MDKRILAAGAAALVVVAGAGAAIAATKLGSPAEESKAVIDDAAKQLGVTPERLTEALKQALENRLDAAVADGRLTQAQADRLKERLESADVPMLFGPGLGGHRHHGGMGFRSGAKLDAAAEYLGVTQAELRDALRDGDSLADVAREQGKSVDGLVDALVAGAKERLDAAVAHGRLTAEQRDRMLQGIQERVGDMVNGERPFGPRRMGF